MVPPDDSSRPPIPDVVVVDDSATDDNPQAVLFDSDAQERLPAFDAHLWEVGTTWTFLYHRESEEESDPSLGLEYYVERRVEQVTPHEWGSLVRLVDHGGISAPRSIEYLVTSSCVMSTRGDPYVCLPFDLSQEVTDTIAGQQVYLTPGTAGRVSLMLDSQLGFVEESELDREGRVHHMRLVGYRIGDRRGGESEIEPMTCDGHFAAEQGERVGNATRPTTPELEYVNAWGLRRQVWRFVAPLTISEPLTQLTAWADADNTVYRVDAGEPVFSGDEPTSAGETVDMPLENVKVWAAPDGSAEYIALTFRENSQSQMRILRVTAEGVETQDVLPRSGERGERYNLYLLANTAGCYLQVRHTQDDQVTATNLALTAAGLTP
jgi:hypothetical protein